MANNQLRGKVRSKKKLFKAKFKIIKKKIVNNLYNKHGRGKNTQKILQKTRAKKRKRWANLKPH